MGLEGVEPSALIRDFLAECSGYAVVDGGFATELERHGQDLNDPLWSAKCLISSPELVRRVHLDYLEVGANVIISASYQATVQGFEAKGLSTEEAETLIKRSVEIACEARQIYLQRCAKGCWDFLDTGNTTQRPVLVAASVGSYGAYLADGSEYSGHYGDSVTLETLKDFHRRRAYAELLREENISIPAWFSFTSKEGINTVSGDSIAECAYVADSCNRVVAFGINCTPPRLIHGLILSIKKVENKPVIIYPNSGETYNAETNQREKSEGKTEEDFVTYVGKWRDAGASLFGGCCRTTPNTIRAITSVLFGKASLDN
ncbi:Homocysteine S-methyltransferase 2 [Hibiscus syriacus]|uniref:Homocysteine S-methyltransferase 2 n=1 Tax=Hibiscus syriacus TaxID=106335 RepID=A0A6A3BHU4_HIBSY|nr:Homocysteine S-methyltransferase 2 [Hibiscus syriacus]